jgi:IS30 family transposase
MKFAYKLSLILSEQGKSFYSIEKDIGLARTTIYRGIKRKTTLAAIAYYVGMTVEELVEGTDAMDIWYG